MFLLILFLLYLATPHNLQDLSSPTKDWTQAIAMKAVSPNFWLLLLFSHSVVSNSLQPYGLQHARLPCPSLSAGVCLNSCPLSNAIQPSHPCHPLLLPSVYLSVRVFSNKWALHISWPKDWSFSVSISPSNEYSELISFRIDWFDLLPLQGTLKSLLQHYNSKASILWRSAFFMVQLSHPYMTTGKTITLTMWAFIGKVMSAF